MLLLAHFHFSPTHKPTLKNAKELPIKHTTTETTTTDRRAAYNKVLAKVAVQCYANTFVVN